MERRYTLTSTHTTSVHPYNDPATRAAATDTLRPDGLHVPFHDESDESCDVRVDATFHAASHATASQASHAVRAAESAAPRPATSTPATRASRATATHAVRAAESAAPRPATRAVSPARRGFTQRAAAFLFFLTVLTLNIFTPAHAADITLPTGKVRWGFENKTISYEDAKKIIDGTVAVDDAAGWGPGYVDLWTYAYFDYATFNDDRFFRVSGNSYTCRLRLSNPNYHFYVTDTNNGTWPNIPPSVARIALKGTQPDYTDEDHTYAYWSTPSWQTPDWNGFEIYATGSTGTAPSSAVDIVQLPGETGDFFRVKMFKVRFNWLKSEPASFYVTFYAGNVFKTWQNGGATSGAVVCQMYEAANNDPVKACSDQANWVQAGRKMFDATYTDCNRPDCFKFIQGGVEIISGFEGEISPKSQTLCPDVEAVDTLYIRRFKNSATTWANVSNVMVQYYNGSWMGNKAVGSSVGADPYIEVINGGVAPSREQPTKVVLHVPKDYHRNTYDSIRLSITVDGETHRFPFEVRYHQDPKLKIAFADYFGNFGGSISFYGKKAGVGGDKDTIVGIAEGTRVGVTATNNNSGIPAATKYTTSGSPESVSVCSTLLNDVQGGTTKLHYASSLLNGFNVVEASLIVNKAIEYTINNSGYYFLSYQDKASGCTLYTDTVYVKVKKPLPAPSISLQSQAKDCQAADMMKLTAVTDQPGTITKWEWAVGTNAAENYSKNLNRDGTDDPTTASGVYYFLVENNGPVKTVKPRIDGNGYTLSYQTSSSGSSSVFEAVGNLQTLMDVGGDYYEYLLCMSGASYYDEYSLWPPANPTASTYTSNYQATTKVGFKNAVFFARYYTAGGDVSKWGVFTYDCNSSVDDKDYADIQFLASFGLTATSCIAKGAQCPYINPYPDCSTDTTVDAGTEVTFRAFVSFPKESLNEALVQRKKTLADYKTSLVWLYSADDGATWTTWHVSGLLGGAADDGFVDNPTKINTWNNPGDDVSWYDYNVPTITVKRTINQKEQHRVMMVYRTSTGDCKWYASWVESWTNVAGDGNINGKYNNFIVYGAKQKLDPQYETYPMCGFYDTLVVVDVNSTKGKLYVGKHGEAVNKDHVDICYGNTVDLKLEAQFPSGTPALTWQDSVAGSTWKTITPALTTMTPGNVLPRVTESEALASGGKTVYYRVGFDGGKGMVYTDPVAVKVQAARKVRMGWADYNDIHKSQEAGYCAGVNIYVYATDLVGNTDDDGSNPYFKGMDYIYQKVGAETDFIDPHKTEASYSTGAWGPSYMDGSAGGFHRIVTRVGECLAYSDTVEIKIHEKPTATITPNPVTVCAGKKVTLRGGGTPQADRITYTWTYGNSFGSKRVEPTVDTFAETFPIAGTADGAGEKVRLVISQVHGSTTSTKPEDTIACYSAPAEVTINTITCKPKLDRWKLSAICAGESDTLFWTVDDNFGEFECGKDELYYAVSPSTSYQLLGAPNYTCEKYVDNNGKVAGVYIILKSTSSILNPNTVTTYRFKAAKNGDTQSDPTDPLTVNPKPVIAPSMVAGTAAPCEGGAAVTISINNGTLVSGSTGGTFKPIDWKKDGVALSVTAGATSYTTPNPVTKADSGLYSARVYYKDGAGCTSDTMPVSVNLDVKSKPTMPTITMPNDTLFCKGGSGSITATVTPAIPAGGADDDYTYNISWYQTSSATVPATNTGTLKGSSQTLTLASGDLPSNTTTFNYYYFVVKKTNKHTGCNDEVRSSKAVKVGVRDCDFTVTPVAVCIEDTATATFGFGLTTPSGVTAITLLKGGVVVPAVVTPAPSASVTSYTLKPVPAPSTTVNDYTIRVETNGTNITKTADYTIYPKPRLDEYSDYIDEGIDPSCLGYNDRGVLWNVRIEAGAPDGEYTFEWYKKDTLKSTKTWVKSSANITNHNYKIRNKGELVQWSDTTTHNLKVWVKATAANHSCLSDTLKLSNKLKVTPLPKPGITFQDTALCEGSDYDFGVQNIDLPATDGVNYSCAWYGSVNSGAFSLLSSNKSTIHLCKRNSDGSASPCPGGTSLAKTTDIWKLRLRVIANQDGCWIDSIADMQVTVKPRPTFTKTDKKVTVCEGVDTTLAPAFTLGNGAKVVSYAWTYGSNPTVIHTDSTFKLTNVSNSGSNKNTGDYNVKIKVKNDVGCDTSFTVKVTLDGITKPTMRTGMNREPFSGEICEGTTGTEPIYITGKVIDGHQNGDKYTYIWLKDGVEKYRKTNSPNVNESYRFVSDAAVALTDSGTYKVKIIKERDGCLSNPDSQQFHVAVHPKATKPGVSFAATSPIEICSGNPVDLEATVTDAAGNAIYRWTKGGSALTTPSPNPAKYSIASAATSNSGDYKLEVVNVTDKGCRDSADASITLTVNATPTNPTVSLTDQKICSTESLTLNATARADNSSSVSFRWFTGSDTSTFVAATGSTASYSPTKPTVTATSATITQAYTVKATFGANGCSAEATATATITVVKQPETITITFDPTSATVCKGSPVTVDGTVSPVPNGNYTYTWAPHVPGASATTTTANDANINITSAQTSDGKEYTLSVKAQHGDASTKVCTATQTQKITITVTEPIDLSAIKIKDSNADSCISGGAHTLSVDNMPPASSIPAGATPTYTWTKPDGSDATTIGADGAKLSVPAKLSNSGTYKVVVVIPPVASNPCTSKDSATINLRFKFCGEEPLTPGTGQANNIVFICQNDKASDGSWVEYTPADNSEPATIKKVSWYKSASAFTTGITGGTQIGSDITPTYTWPLKLTQQEVFGTANAPTQYYVRARIEREQNGVVSVTYSDTYRFALVQNAPKVSNHAIAPVDDTICLNGTSASPVFTASHGTLADPSGYGSWGLTKAQKEGSTGLTYMWKWDNDAAFSPAANGNTKTVTVNGERGQVPMSVKVVSSYYYSLSGTEKYCRDTTDAVEGKVTTTLPPVIASFTDKSNATAKMICANTDANDYPELEVSVTTGTVEKWERQEGASGTWVDMGLAEGTTSHKLTAADVPNLPAAGAADKTYKYRVTVKNGSKCNPVSEDYTLTVVSMPNLGSAVITGNSTAPEFEFCGSGTITAKPKKKTDGTDYSGTPVPTYKWQKSATGTDPWTDVAGVTSAALNLTTAPDNNYYRCIVTVSKTVTSNGLSATCPAEVTTSAQQVTVSPSSSVGTSSIDDAAICTSQKTYFRVTGNTGNVSKIEISNSAGTKITVNTPTMPFEIDPKSTDPNIKSLLSASSRKTTLSVNYAVKSGGVCSELPGVSKNLIVYEPAPKITIGNIPVLCGTATRSITSTTNTPPGDNQYYPAIETGFEKIQWTYGTNTSGNTTLNLTYDALAPKYKSDTVYKLTATVTNTQLASGVCGPTESDEVEFHVKRKPKAPVASKDTSLCEDGTYKVSAVRPAESPLVWKKDGAALPAAEVVSVNGNVESIEVSNAAVGTYKYTISDTACGQADADVKVTVNRAPVAGTISVPALTNGDFCRNSGTNVQVTADADSYTLPTGGTISWQVCTDTSNYLGTKQTSLETGMSGATYSKVSTSFTAGTTYYIRYGVSGASCDPDYSRWVAVKVIAQPTVDGFAVSSGNNNHICVDSTVTLTVTGKPNLKYEIFTNTANNTTGGSSLKIGNLGAAGSDTYNVTPSATTYYYVMVTDTSYHGNGTCNVSNPSSVMTVNVDPKNVGGKLTFTNTDITGQPTDNGKKLEGNVGEHTAQLKLSDDATGNSKQLNGMSDKGVAVPAKNINADNKVSLPLTTDHMSVTQLWVVVSGGACPDAYSDTVQLKVNVGSEPTLSATTICQGSASTLTISVPDAIQTEGITVTALEYEKDGAWTKVEDVTFVGPSGTASNWKITVVEPDGGFTENLTAGDYKLRFKYKVGSADETESLEATLHIDAPSVGGKLASTLDTVCQNGTSPKLTLSGHTGEVQGTYFSATDDPFTGTRVGTSKDTTNLFSVPTSDLTRSGYYQVTVKNGVCPEAYSTVKEVRVIQAPAAGTLSASTACYNGSSEVKMVSGAVGNIIVWKTSSTEGGPYTDVPGNNNKLLYTTPNLTDHLFVKVAVTTHAVCPAVESAPLEVKVFDTLKFTQQPTDQSVVVGNDVKLNVVVDNSGLKYDNGTGSPFESAMTHIEYMWQLWNEEDSQWENISNGDAFAGVKTPELTIKKAHAEDYVDHYFRCIVMDRECRVLESNRATITLLADLKPGETRSLTACECYYSTDEATYYVEGASGQGTLEYRWEVSTEGTVWQRVEDVFGSDLASVCKGYDKDTIVFFQIGKLYNDKGMNYIRAWVSDEVNTTGLATTGKTVDVCMVNKPVYTFDGAIVCEREGAGVVVAFPYTANPSTIQDREITYKYILPTNADRTVDGTITNTYPTIHVGGKQITFAIDGDDNLTIPASSAIPFEADSMVIRMEVRSCYTPDIDHLGTNTDTTIDVLLRVDKAPELTLLRDTIVCKGSDVTLTARALAFNTTIPGNEIRMQITPGGLPQDMSVTAVNTVDYTITNVQSDATYTAKARTMYCPEKTATATVTVKEVPVLASLKADSVCVGNALNFVATVNNYDPSTCQIRWLKKEGGVWDTIAQDLTTYTKSNVTAQDAGEYKLFMRITVPSCADVIEKPFTFKVLVTPQITLSTTPYPGNVLVVSTKEVTVASKLKTLQEMGYDAALIPYLKLAPVSEYEWYIQKKGETSFEQLTGSNHSGFVNSAVNKASITFKGFEEYDSTLFYVIAKTACADVETQKDTLRVTDKFAITNADATMSSDNPACEGDDVTLTVTTSAPASSVIWKVSKDNGATWEAISWPTAQYDSTWSDGTYTLTIHNVSATMEGWMYDVAVSDGEEVDEASNYGYENQTFRLHIDQPVSFTCTDVFETHDRAVAVGGYPATSNFTFKLGCQKGCVGSDHSCDLSYAYDLRKPSDNDYGNVGGASTYEFIPDETYLGMNYIRFSAGNHCGWDTAYDSVLVIMKPEPGTVTGIPTEPGKGPDEPIEKDVKGPVSENITVEVCEGNTLYLAATYTGGPAKDIHWVYGDGTVVPMSSPYSLRHDTLVINPVSYDEINGKTFRCVFEMPDPVADIQSYDITVNVNRKPSVQAVEVEIWDETNKDAEGLESGQALPDGTVVLSVPNAPADYTKICFYQAFVHEESEGENIKVVVDSVRLLPGDNCTHETTYELTDKATVEEHDNTWYYAQIYNDCGYDSTMPYQLRVFEDLEVVWIPDTLIPRPTGEYDIDTLYPDPHPGDLVILYGPGEKPEDTAVQLDAHLWICQNAEFWVKDTTLSGFMNRENMDDVRGSRWFYRKTEDGEWLPVDNSDDPWNWLTPATEVLEHRGNLGFDLPGDPNMDGWQFRAAGVNARYSDTTCIITLHVIPAVEPNDLVMNPAVLCEEPGAEFKLTSDKDLTKLTIDWQVKTEGSDAWSDNITALHDSTTYKLGGEGLPLNVREVRAIAQGACGSDTAYGIIKTPVAPGVKLIGDSVCLGESLLLTAVDTGQAGHSKFEWYVDDELVADATGETFDMSAYAVGNYTVRVVMTADLTSNGGCVLPHTAQAEDVAVIYPLPQIEAFIADTVMKNIDTTSVWVKGQGDYTYAWTPETGLFDAKADSSLLWGLEPQQEPYWYKVTATNEYGCQAVDSVHVRIESNFTIDSFSIVVVVPPVLDLDDGTLPGYPDEQEKAYYPDLGGSPFGGELMFRNDTVADLWICAHNTALIHFNVRGGEEPIRYTWTIHDGNATLVYPVDAKEDNPYSFKDPEKDSVFGVFFPDTTTHTMYCEIYDNTGVGGRITIRVHYYRPEMFYLEVTPKVTSGKYYEQQAMNFFVRPDRDWLTTWIVVRDGEVKDTVTNRKMNRQMSFTKEEGDETSIWISTVDRHGCRIWDSVPIRIIPLPNVLLLGDPMYGVIFPEFEVEITNTWGLKVKAFEDRNGNGSSRGWDGRTKSGTYVVAGTYYYRAKVPTLDKKGYMIVNGAVTVVNK